MIKTKLHHYCFDLRIEEDKVKWEDLQGKLAPIHHLQHCSHAGGYQPITGNNSTEEVELETKFLFDDQWNEVGSDSKNGRRLFDWYLEYRLENKNIKQGHWLDQTQEMLDIRHQNKTCGYCGGMSIGQEVFCTKCLGSEYLEERYLPLLRLRRFSSVRGETPPLTEEEKAWLIQQYEVAQGLGKEHRDLLAVSKLRKKVAALVPDAEVKARGLILEAYKKTEAFTWLLDHKFRDIGNVIYYSHTDKFCFGWSKPYGADASVLKESLREFPFDFEVK
jgi:hypothetical protein